LLVLLVSITGGKVVGFSLLQFLLKYSVKVVISKISSYYYE